MNRNQLNAARGFKVKDHNAKHNTSNEDNNVHFIGGTFLVYG